MTSPELLALLQELLRERLTLFSEHQAAACRVGQYQFNNTYQYIIAREEVHLQWLADAIARLGGPASDAAGGEAPSTGARLSAADTIAADLDREQRFVDRWRQRVDALTNARHQKMLQVILGESLEHVRFFAQAAAGDVNLLGRSATGAGQRGHVIAQRWRE